MNYRIQSPILIILTAIVVSCAPWTHSHRSCEGALCAAQATQESGILNETVSGPVIPQWPAPGAYSMEREFQAAARFLNELDNGDDYLPLDGIPLLQGETPRIHVTEGRVGGFAYLEVIIGYEVSPDEPLPLLVLFHGRGGRPEVPEGYDAIKEPVRILLPRAPQKLDEGYTWLPTYSRSPKRDLFTNSLRDVTNNLNVAIAEFTQQRPTVGKPILMGFSQGGILAWTLATRFPARYSAVFPTAAWVPERLIPSSIPEDIVLPRVHAMHGSNDEVVPTDYGRRTVAKLRRAGWEIEFKEYKGVEHYQTTEMEKSLDNLLGETLRMNPEFIKVYVM